MIFFCEDCGERYIMEELEIRAEIIFNCRKCGYLIKVTPLPKTGANSREVK